MPTTVLNVYSKGYPSIIQRLRASVFLQSDPQALVATQIDTTAGHPARTWQFPGLEKNNYGFSLDVIDGAGSVLTNLALFDVVPGQYEGGLRRSDEQIKVGVTPGFIVGNNSFVFDGTNGTPNYIGWDIVPSELNGRGILIKDTDYVWDAITATFQLLLAGDIFSVDTVYNIHFNDNSDSTGASTETNVKDIRIIYSTLGRQLTAGDFQKKLIIEPNGTYLEYVLPQAITVPQGRVLMVEVDAPDDCCVKFVTSSGDVIKFLRGNVYACPKESFEIYKYIRNGLSEFRVYNDIGNFRSVGQIVYYDQIESEVFNALPFDGRILNSFQYARLYNEVVLRLPLSKLISFEAHELTPENRALYSTANDTGDFYLPYRPVANQYVLI